MKQMLTNAEAKKIFTRSTFLVFLVPVLVDIALCAAKVWRNFVSLTIRYFNGAVHITKKSVITLI